MIFALPAITFLGLWGLERVLPTLTQSHSSTKWDHVLNVLGLMIQGCVVPVIGYWISQSILPFIAPKALGILHLGWWGAFLLNFIFVDFLYYWQHRAFHRFSFLWNLHQCHHASKRVDIWTTSRNSVLINFLFVYFWVNPVLAFLCDAPLGFYTGAMITASLDIFRHSHLDLHKILPHRFLNIISKILVMPCQHHHHHRKTKRASNLSANFIVWDILFDTAEIQKEYPEEYGLKDARHPVNQLLYPIKKE